MSELLLFRELQTIVSAVAFAKGTRGMLVGTKGFTEAGVLAVSVANLFDLSRIDDLLEKEENIHILPSCEWFEV